ncbi:MAG: D-aminoacylase, partial [Bacteroidetes bacterium]|nr:D-aminoacylase [Bacteroidota bacterium]
MCDVLIYNGTVYDGSGENPYLGSVGITDDKITYVGKNTRFEADTIIDATNLSVSPGFINMLSW